MASADSSEIEPPDPPQGTYTIEQTLFHALRSRRIHNPSPKEFNESFAFCNAVRSFVGSDYDIVLDVAGGHGALAALFLILTRCQEAVVIDPAVVEGGHRGIRKAWTDHLAGKILRYRHECLRTGLPAELQRCQASGLCGAGRTPRCLVVACHACQHLTEETLAIACDFGAHVCVMPCCQKDHVGAWKDFARSLGADIGVLLDVLSAGRLMHPAAGTSAQVQYTVRMKLLSRAITPQNRLILCRAAPLSEGPDACVVKAHAQLAKAYRRAHFRPEPISTEFHEPSDLHDKESPPEDDAQGNLQSVALGLGSFLAGAICVLVLIRPWRK